MRSILESLRDKVENGSITIREAAIALHKKEYTKKKYEKIYEIDKLLNDCVMRHRNV